MNLTQSNNYVKSHGILIKDHQVFLTKPLKVFKKIQTYSPYYADEFKNMGFIGITDKHRSLYSRLKTRPEHNRRWHHTEAIANLIIPLGAIVNLASTSEMKYRASEAYCWSICTRYIYPTIITTAREVLSGYSAWDNNCIYISGKSIGLKLSDLENMTRTDPAIRNHINKISKCIVKPDSFNNGNKECSNGIHFFLESELAVKY